MYLHACTERNAHYGDLRHLFQTSDSWQSVPKDVFSHSGTGAQNGNDTQHRAISRQLSLNQIANAVTTLSVGPSHVISLTVPSHTYKYNLIFLQHNTRRANISISSCYTIKRYSGTSLQRVRTAHNLQQTVKLSLSTMKVYRQSRVIAPHIPNSSTRVR